MKGEEILRVTGRKDRYGELEEFICNDCRFGHKQLKDWVVEGPRMIERHSVISQNHYQTNTISGSEQEKEPAKNNLNNDEQ